MIDLLNNIKKVAITLFYISQVVVVFLLRTIVGVIYGAYGGMIIAYKESLDEFKEIKDIWTE